MEGWVIAVVVILALLMLGISGLVGYLLYRPGARKRTHKNGMTPDGQVATKYADPPENGDVKLTMPSDSDDTIPPPYASKGSTVNGKRKDVRLDIDEDSDPDQKALLREVKVEPQERAVDVGKLEGEAPEGPESSDEDEEKKFIKTPSTKDESSSASSLSGEEKEDRKESGSKRPEEKPEPLKESSSSSSSSSEGEIPEPMAPMKPHIIRDDAKDGVGARDSPDLVSDVLAVVDGKQTKEPSSTPSEGSDEEKERMIIVPEGKIPPPSSSDSSSEDEEGGKLKSPLPGEKDVEPSQTYPLGEGVERKSGSSSSSDEGRLLKPSARERKPRDASKHPIAKEGDRDISAISSSSSPSDEDRPKTAPTPKERVQTRPIDASHPGESSSSSSEEEKIVPVVAPRTTRGKKPSATSSSSSDADDERKIRVDDVPTQTTPPRKRSKKKKKKKSTPPTVAKFPISTQTPKEEDASSSSSEDAEVHRVRPVTSVPVETTKEKTSSSSTSEDETDGRRKIRPRENITFWSIWNRPATLYDLHAAGVVSDETADGLKKGTIKEKDVAPRLRPYLMGEEPVSGILISETGEKISIYSAWKRGVIRRAICLSLLEAQAATGRILDPKTGARYSVEEAVKAGLIDKQLEGNMARAERAVYGYTTRESTTVVSLHEAMKKEMVVEEHGIRLLEAQIATGGIIDPNVNHRLPLKVACERGLLDERTKEKLESPGDEIRGFLDPNTEERVTYSELIKRCVVDTDTGMRLFPLRTERPSWAKPKAQVEKTPTPGIPVATQTENISSTSSSTSTSSTSEAEMEITIARGEISTQTPEYPKIRKKKRKLPKTYKRVSPPVERTPSLRSGSIPSSESERELYRYTARVGPRPFSASPPTYTSISPRSEMSTQTVIVSTTKPPKRTESKEPIRPSAPMVIRMTDSSVQTERISSTSSSSSESEEEVRRTTVRTERDYPVSPVGERLVQTGVYVKEQKVITSQTRHEPHREMEPVLIDLGRQDRYKVVTVVDVPPPAKKIFFTASWGNQVDLNSLHEAGIVNSEMKTRLETGELDPSDEVVIRLIMPYISCNRPIAGILLTESGKKISISEAAKRGLIRRTTAIALLEAQAATGNLVDPHTGQKMTVEQAQKEGLIDGGYEAVVIKAERAVRGYETRSAGHPLSVFEAMKHGIIKPSQGIRLLEAQLATGGIVDPKVGHRVPLEAAYRRKLFDQHTMNLLNDPKNEDKGFVDPNTQKNVTYLEIVSKCVTDLETGVLLFPLESQERGRSPKTSASVKSTINLDVTSPSRSRSRERSEAFSLPKASTSSASSSSDESRRKKAKKETISVHRSIELIKTPVMSGEEDDAFESARSRSTKHEFEAEERSKRVKEEIVKRLDKETIVQEEKATEVSTAAFTLESKQTFEPVLFRVDLNEPEKTRKESSSTSEEEKMEVEETKDVKTVVEKDSTSEFTTTTTVVTTTEVVTKKKRRSRADIKFKSGWNRKASLLDLFAAGVVTQETVTNLEEGLIQEEDVENNLKQYLIGAEPIAGILISETGEKISIYSAWRKGLIRRGTSISLLEAQAATGRILDPKSGARCSVAEASKKGLIDRQFEAVLTRAERAVYGYTTRTSPQVLSLFQAMKRGLVVENHGIRLLEAQIATGGIIDPNANHRLPVEIAYERGLFDKRMNEILEDPSDDTRGFFDPNTEENLTYLELMERCITDTDTGMRLLPLRTHRVSSSPKKSKVVFESKTGRQVTLADLVNASRVDAHTAKRIDEGTMTSEEKDVLVAKLRVFVDGTMPIAGIINTDTGERMSIYEAAKCGLIRRGTAFELLEAQACCGKLVDVQRGRVITIETALRSGVIDKEFKDVVERAHRAVTGYREPFKRELLSLCEAINRHLIVRRHGMRLLEAQIATGGIIDVKSPVRITPQVALKRALIDAKLAEELEQKRTQSYFDPVTGENLNYSEMMGRCVTDKDSGLLYLMVEGGTVTGYVRPFEPEHASRIRSQSASPGRMLTEEVTTTRSASATKLGSEATTTIETTESRKKRKKKSRNSSGLSASSASSTTETESTGAESPSIISRKVIIVDPDTNEELSVREALKRKLIDKETARQLIAQQGEFEEAP